MNRTISIVAATLIAAAAGCSNNNTKPAASLQQPNQSVTQLTPPPVAQAPADGSQADQVAALDTSTPNMASEIQGGPSSSSVGGKYTVKAGDTLFRIAATHYGSGKEWKKIAAANPGLDPKHLRVGQKITLP
jgi:5'-nucleotidase / UDP-sugar diphosphatase